MLQFDHKMYHLNFSDATSNKLQNLKVYGFLRVHVESIYRVLSPCILFDMAWYCWNISLTFYLCFQMLIAEGGPLLPETSGIVSPQSNYINQWRIVRSQVNPSSRIANACSSLENIRTKQEIVKKVKESFLFSGSRL